MEKITNEETNEFLNDIDKLGFKNAQNNFLNKKPEFETEFIRTQFNQTIDPMFHCFTKNNNRCLQLSAGFGGGTESLSNIYNEVFCYEKNHNTNKILKAKLEFLMKKNIILCENLNEITIKKDFFDLVICQNISEVIKLKHQEINSFLTQIFDIINNDGCFCFGVKSQDLLKLNTNRIDFSEKITNESQLEALKKILTLKGFRVDIFWVLPSLEKPYYSSDNSKEIPLIWYVKNLQKFVKEEKLSMKQKAISLLKGKIGEKIIKYKIKTILNDFIFCCYKNEFSNSIENIVKKETGCKNNLMVSRPQKVNFISFNDNQPTKIINLQRYGNSFPLKIKNVNRTLQNLKNPTDRVWMEDWFNGTKLNLSNEKEILLAVEWLINFQKNTRSEIISKSEIKKEINETRNKLLDLSFSNKNITDKWLNDYEKNVNENKILKTSVHGDFWINNILVTKDNKINVIDWELFSEKGNPFIDFMKFFMRWIMKTEKSNIDAEILEKNLSGNENFMKIYPKIKNKMDIHFGFKLNFMIILRYFLLRRISMATMTEQNFESFSKIVKILSTKYVLQ